MSEAADNHSEPAETARDVFKGRVPGEKLSPPPDAGIARSVLMKVAERTFPLFP